MFKMEDNESPNFQTKELLQFAAAGVAALGAFGLGTVASYTSTALPDMKMGEFANLTNEFSWVGSIAPIGACMSGPVAGFMIEAIGRKRAMLLIAPVFVLGWLLIGFASEISMVYAGRFFTGTASACATSFNWINTFVVTKVFDNIQYSIGIQWDFWIFGIASGLGTIFVYFVVPETKGKTLGEIQMLFIRKEL